MSEINNELRLTGKIFATGIMSFCGVVSETAMNVTFPTLMNEFSIGTSTVQWITTGYLLILSLVITMSSYLKRNFSTRQLFLTAITLFIVATALCYWSPAFWVLLCGRMLQGIGTGIALPLMFNIILAEAPKEKLGVFMGVGSLITAMAPAIGPVLGGYIVDEFGWRVIFLVLLFLLVPSLLLGAWLIKHEDTGDKSRFHLLEYILICTGYSAFILATVRASADGWLSWQVLGLMLLSLVSIWLFVRQSRNVGLSERNCGDSRGAVLYTGLGVCHSKLLTDSQRLHGLHFRTAARARLHRRSRAGTHCWMDSRPNRSTEADTLRCGIPPALVAAVQLVWRQHDNSAILWLLYRLHDRPGSLCGQHDDLRIV